jgi:hypothetical protein
MPIHLHAGHLNLMPACLPACMTASINEGFGIELEQQT